MKYTAIIHINEAHIFLRDYDHKIEFMRDMEFHSKEVHWAKLIVLGTGHLSCEYPRPAMPTASEQAVSGERAAKPSSTKISEESSKVSRTNYKLSVLG